MQNWTPNPLSLIFISVASKELRIHGNALESGSYRQSVSVDSK
jgi:hypothetical protein